MEQRGSYLAMFTMATCRHGNAVHTLWCNLVNITWSRCDGERLSGADSQLKVT